LDQPQSNLGGAGRASRSRHARQRNSVASRRACRSDRSVASRRLRAQRGAPCLRKFLRVQRNGPYAIRWERPFNATNASRCSAKANKEKDGETRSTLAPRVNHSRKLSIPRSVPLFRTNLISYRPFNVETLKFVRGNKRTR
jgi:hypothetical protein